MAEPATVPFMSFSIPTFLVLLLTSAAFYLLYQCLLHPLASIPGPFLARFSRLWMVQHSLAGDMNATMIALHRKHGALVRTGPNEVSVSDITAIKTIYGAGSKFGKSDWYSVWQGHRKFDLFGERDERVHGEQRRLVSRAYSMGALRDLEGHVDEAIAIFIEKMNNKLGTVVDMGNWLQLFAFDVIGALSFSKTFGFMEAGADDGSFKQIEGALQSAAWVGQIPSIYWVHDRLMPYIGSYLKITNRHTRLRDMAVSEVDARRSHSGDHQDILTSLFATQKSKPLEMNDNAITSMATTNIFAGSDTTAISTRAVIYFLLKNPTCKERLIEEIDTLRHQGKLSDPVTLSEADDMPYLQAALYEALRLHPAVGMSLPRVVPESAAVVVGKHLPAGCVVGANPWVVHRNKEVYGEDVETFRPERWLQAESNGDMHRFFFAFGAGSRMCLGRNISWMEMSKLIATLFLRYEIKLSEPEATWSTTCWWFVMQHGLNVIVHPR